MVWSLPLLTAAEGGLAITSFTSTNACTTPESWKRLPQGDSLGKVVVFKSQHRPHMRSENDPPLSALWRGNARAHRDDNQASLRAVNRGLIAISVDGHGGGGSQRGAGFHSHRRLSSPRAETVQGFGFGFRGFLKRRAPLG